MRHLLAILLLIAPLLARGDEDPAWLAHLDEIDRASCQVRLISEAIEYATDKRVHAKRTAKDLMRYARLPVRCHRLIGIEDAELALVKACGDPSKKERDADAAPASPSKPKTLAHGAT
jgi:hypothetical protein